MFGSISRGLPKMGNKLDTDRRESRGILKNGKLKLVHRLVIL